MDPTPEQFSAPRIQAMVDAHDEAGLAAADVHHAALPSGAEALYLGRALAAYADQRGRRADAEARYAALLRRASDDQAARAAIYCDLAELAHRWQGIAGMEAHLTAATAAAAAVDDWSLTARWTPPWDPRPAARCANRRRSAAWSASSRPTDA